MPLLFPLFIIGLFAERLLHILHVEGNIPWHFSFSTNIDYGTLNMATYIDRGWCLLSSLGRIFRAIRSIMLVLRIARVFCSGTRRGSRFRESEIFLEQAMDGENNILESLIQIRPARKRNAI